MTSGYYAEAMDGLWELYIEDIDVGPLVQEGVLNSWGVRIAEEIVSSVSSSDITIQGASSAREYTCVTAPITKLGVMPESLPFSVTVPNGDGDLDLDGF